MEYLNPQLIKTNPYQPRQNFTPEEIHHLAKSIKSYGLLQPLVVRKKGDTYELIAGERRLRACLLLKLPQVPVIITQFNDQSSALLALIENVQRENLNPLEEAQGYQLLKEDFALTQEQIAQQVGKSRAHIANIMRLLNLTPGVKHLLLQRQLSMGQAKPLLALTDPHQQLNTAHHIIANKLSARQAEALVKKINTQKPLVPKGKSTTAYQVYLEDIIRRRLGTAVQLKLGKNKNKLEITFQNEEDLERILDILDPGETTPSSNPPKNFSV